MKYLWTEDASVDTVGGNKENFIYYYRIKVIGKLYLEGDNVHLYNNVVR